MISKRFIISILSIFIFPFSATSAFAAIITISPSQSIQTVVNTANSGDTIQVRAGTYPSFTISKNNLIIAGYPGERPILSGGSGIVLSGSGIIFSNFEVTSMSANQSAAILSRGSDNIIKDNLVHGNISQGTNGIIVMGTNNRVENNTLHNNNRMGIGIYNSSGNIITNNTVYNNKLSAGDSDGIHCIGDSAGQSHDNIIRDNITYENADDGIDTWNCTSNQIIGNISHHNGGTGDGHGIKLGYGGNNIVKNNTSYSNLACGFTSNGSGNSYENNIAYSNAQCGFTDSYRVPGNTGTSSFINNVAYNNPTNYVKGQYTTVFTGNSESAPSPPPSTIPIKPGDANGDNKVDGIDYIVWLNHYSQSVSGATNGDFNNSGIVDGVDYVVWLNNYGK